MTQAKSGDFQAAVLEALSHVEGTFGLVVVSPLHPGTIIAARNGSPIVVGIGQDETLIASDVSALLSHTNQVVYLDDGDVVTATPDSFEITSLKNLPVSRAATEIDWNLEMGAICRRALETGAPSPIFNKVKGCPNGFRAAEVGYQKSGKSILKPNC